MGHRVGVLTLPPDLWGKVKGAHGPKERPPLGHHRGWDRGVLPRLASTGPRPLSEGWITQPGPGPGPNWA